MDPIGSAISIPTLNPNFFNQKVVPAPWWFKLILLFVSASIIAYFVILGTIASKEVRTPHYQFSSILALQNNQVIQLTSRTKP